MAVNEIQFRELPFRPGKNQVFYIENGYDRGINDFIHNNYQRIKSMFTDIGLEFYYLPYLMREHDIEAKVRYYAPYLSPKLLTRPVHSDALVQFIADADTRRDLKPSLIYGAEQEGYTGDTRFVQAELPETDYTKPDALEALAAHLVHTGHPVYERLEIRLAGRGICSASSRPSPGSLFKNERLARRKKPTESKDESLAPREEPTDEVQSLVETERILRELRQTVQKLRLEGVSLMAIHEFIDKQEPLSRMVITPDYRIILPDYNDMEIEMGALPKAIYFLYLRCPGGIVYKHMQDYYTELLNIYKQLRPNTDQARLTLTITKVVNPLGNALNENIARIRKAFVEKFDEHLACNYIVSGERGSQYSIPLDRDLIIWEE